MDMDTSDTADNFAGTVRAKADDHAALLRELASLDYVPAAVVQHSQHLAGLRKELSSRKEQVAILEEKSKKEFKDWRKIQNSKTKRFFVRASHGGKKDALEARAEKEEREYIEAFEAERTQKDAVEMLEREVNEEQAVETDLQSKNARYLKLQKDLDHLYRSLFQGPTPAFPAEDLAEEDLRRLEETYNLVQGELNRESSARECLARASQAMIACLKELHTALQYSTYDMFGGGGLSDYMERDALANAKRHAVNVEMLTRRARQTQPQIKAFPRMQIAEGNFLSDVIFDSIFADMTFHRKIEASALQAQSYAQSLQLQSRASDERLRAMHAHVRTVTGQVRTARRALESLRREIVLGVAAGRGVEELAGGLDGGGAGEAEPRRSDELPPHLWGNPYAEAMIARASRADSEAPPPPYFDPPSGSPPPAA